MATKRKGREIRRVLQRWLSLTFNGVPLALFAVALLLASFVWTFPTQETSLAAGLERKSFDFQMMTLRKVHPREAPVEPVLIGIDETAEDSFDEPIAMWHKHFAKFLDAMSTAKPALVGMDVQLPAKSWDHILPGLDIAFLTSLHRIKQNVPFVVVHTFDRTGRLARIHETFLKVLGDESFAFDKVLEDPDRFARRFDEFETVGEGSLDSFSGHIARRMGKPVTAGMIDYSVGGLVRYVPIQEVLKQYADGDVTGLRKRFGGRVVLVGSVTSHVDRWSLPVPLADWERNAKGKLQTNQPGVLVHLQTVRSMLGHGLIQIQPRWVGWVVGLLLLLTVFVPSRRTWYWLVFAAFPVLLMLASVALLANGLYIPAISYILLLWIATMVGAVADGTRTLLEKNRLKQSFSGSVSPSVLQEILSGNLTGGVSAKTDEICVMFSDIRGFTGISESLPPERVTHLLTRYFDRMVACVHRYDGTMDKFMGDGMMVLFGVPRHMDNASSNAVKCAVDMVNELKVLNEEFAAEGLPHLKIGIGINYGKVVVGNIGSTERHNYSAIGDAVNVASRVEGLTKRLGASVVLTDSLKEQLGNEFELVDFGVQAIRGHSPMRLWGVASVAGSEQAAGEPSADE